MLSERTCLFSARSLRDDEFVVRRERFPRLYAGGQGDEESKWLRMIYDQLPTVFEQANEAQRDHLRSFMQLVLRNGTMHKEDFVHRFIFEYWDSLWGSGSASLPLSEKYFKGKITGPQTEFGRVVVDKVYAGNTHIPDIIGLSHAVGGTMYIIEIKNELLDDRALGQILRYYQVARSICDRFRTGCDVRRVSPVLVVPSGDLAFWDSVPFHFREILEILYWRPKSDGSIHLVDGKAILRTSSRDRIWNR